MLQLRDIMTRQVLTVTPDLPLRRAIELLAHHHVSGAPVVDGTEVVGVISADDILEFQAESPDRGDPNTVPLEALPEEPEEDVGFYWDYWSASSAELVERLTTDEPTEGDALQEHTVDDAMMREVLSLPASTPVQAGAAYMSLHGIHRVIVEDEGELVGIVTTTDVTRAVGQLGMGAGLVS